LRKRNIRRTLKAPMPLPKYRDGRYKDAEHFSGAPRDYASAGLSKQSVPLPLEVVEEVRAQAHAEELPVGTFLARLVIRAIGKQKKTKGKR
jgi:hypothetical protein